MNSSCTEVQRLLLQFDSIDEEQLVEVEQHLEECEVCLRQISALSLDLALEDDLREANKLVALPADLISLQSQLIGNEPGGVSTRSREYTSWVASRYVALFAVTAALLIALAFPMWLKAKGRILDAFNANQSEAGVDLEPMGSEWKPAGTAQGQVQQTGTQDVPNELDGDDDRQSNSSELTVQDATKGTQEGESKNIRRPVVRGRNGFAAIELDSGEDEIPFLMLVAPKN